MDTLEQCVFPWLHDWNVPCLGNYLIVSVRTCSPEMPGLFSLQIYFCLYGVIWGRHPLRPPRVRLALVGEFRNIPPGARPTMETRAIRVCETFNCFVKLSAEEVDRGHNIYRLLNEVIESAELCIFIIVLGCNNN